MALASRAATSSLLCNMLNGVLLNSSSCEMVQNIHCKEFQSAEKLVKIVSFVNTEHCEWIQDHIGSKIQMLVMNH